MYFYGLACICEHIQRFVIINTINPDININEGIIKLIEAQKNLRYFEWKDDFRYFYSDDFEDIYGKTLLALEKKVDTLNHLVISFHHYEYNYQDIPIPINLSKFHKLKTLKINALSYDVNDQLNKSVYQNLEILQIDSYIDYSTVVSIIKNSRGNFRKILIKVDYSEIWVDDDDYLNFSRTIYENCPLIEYLSLLFSSSNFVEFEKLLKTCQKLKVLSIFMIHMDDDEFKSDEEKLLKYGEKLSKALVEFASNNLRIIKFSKYHFKFSLKTLESLLENWRGRTALSIITSDPDYENEGYVKIINKYKNDGVIKDFIYEKFGDEYFFDHGMMM